MLEIIVEIGTERRPILTRDDLHWLLGLIDALMLTAPDDVTALRTKRSAAARKRWTPERRAMHSIRMTEVWHNKPAEGEAATR